MLHFTLKIDKSYVISRFLSQLLFCPKCMIILNGGHFILQHVFRYFYSRGTLIVYWFISVFVSNPKALLTQDIFAHNIVIKRYIDFSQ